MSSKGIDGLVFANFLVFPKALSSRVPESSGRLFSVSKALAAGYSQCLRISGIPHCKSDSRSTFTRKKREGGRQGNERVSDRLVVMSSSVYPTHGSMFLNQYSEIGGARQTLNIKNSLKVAYPTKSVEFHFRLCNYHCILDDAK